MHKTTKILLDRINQITSKSPLVYISRDIERSLGLEKYLENFHQLCIEESYIFQQLRERKFNVYSLEKYLDAPRSTLSIVNNIEFTKILENIVENSKFYAQFFQFNEPAKIKIEQKGGDVLNNSALLNRFFESKVNQFKNFFKNKIPQPYGFLENISKLSYSDVTKKISDRFLVQLDIAHTGKGTFFVNSEDEYVEIQTKYFGNVMKFSKFIDGESYTINGCIYKSQVYTQALQYQITGITQLTSSLGATVGNDWLYAKNLTPNTQKEILDIVRKVGEMLIGFNYRGIFGIDLILDKNKNKIYVLEINARQTANIPMETKLELGGDSIPLLLLHIAEFMNIDIDVPVPDSLTFWEGSQIFLRSKKEKLEIVNHFKSGIYQKKAMNNYFDYQTRNLENTIMPDDQSEFYLEYNRDGISIDDTKKEEILLLASRSGEIKNINEEVARMQFKQGIVSKNGVENWIINTLQTIEETITL